LKDTPTFYAARHVLDELAAVCLNDEQKMSFIAWEWTVFRKPLEENGLMIEEIRQVKRCSYALPAHLGFFFFSVSFNLI